MSHIFISYARKDIDFAGKIVQALSENDLDTWIDWKNIPGGEDWKDEIYQGIEQANAFLFLISPDSVRSKMCNKEIAHALKNSKRILPIVIRDADIETFLNKTVKKEIAKLNWIFCRFGQDRFRKAIEVTRKTIHTDYEWLKYHTRLQVKALEWERTKDPSRLLRGKELREAEQQLAIGIKDPQPTVLQRQYLFNSREYEERVRRRSIFVLSLGLIIVAMLAVFAWGQRNNALISEATAIAEANARGVAQAHAEMQAKIALARQIAVQAELIRHEQPNLLEQSVLLAAEALVRFQDLGEASPEAYQTLRQDLALLPRHIVDMKHAEDINLVSYSPDGKWIATSMVDPMHAGYPVMVWRASDGVEIYKLETRARVTDLEFSPDSHSLATGGADYLVQIWDMSTGGKIVSLNHDSYINDVAFGTHGNILASAGDDGSVKIWNLQDTRQKPRSLYHEGAVLALTISPDGKFLATASEDKNIRIWDLRGGNEIGIFEFALDNAQAFIHFFSHHPGARLAFSSDSLLLAVGDTQGLVRIWDVTTRKMRWVSRHENAVTAVVFSPDRKYVASASIDGTVRVWQIDNGREYLRMLHDDGVNNVVYSTSGDYLVSASTDGTARVWETFRGIEFARMTHPVGVGWVALSPDGIHATTFGGKTATIWEISNHREFAKFTRVASIFTVSPDKSHFVAETERGLATVFDISSGDRGRSVKHNDYVDGIVFTRNGTWVATHDRVIVKVWKAIGDSDVIELPYYTKDIVQDMAFSPDARLLAIASTSGRVQIWNWINAHEIVQFQVNGDGISIAFSEDSNFLAVTGKSRETAEDTAWLFDISSGREVGSVGWNNGDIALIYRPTRGLAALNRTLVSHPHRPSEVVVANFINPTLSPDGRYVIRKTIDTLVIMETATGKEIWQLDLKPETLRLKLKPEYVRASFSPDGRFIVTWSASSHSTSLQFWLWRTQDLLEEACSRPLRNLTHAEWSQYVGADIPYHATCSNLTLLTK